MNPETRTPGGNRANERHSRQLQDNSTPPSERLLPRLDRVRQTGPDQWLASCPGPLHENGDRNPSLSIRQADDRLLLCCHAGCGNDEIMSALGMALADLFDRPLGHHKAPLSKYQRRRHGQAAEALKALLHEVRIVYVLAEQMAAGFNLDPAELERLKLAMTRIRNAEAVAA